MTDENGDEIEAGLPVEVLLLEMAGYDPLRAMEIEAGLSRRWWRWWVADRQARVEASSSLKR
jgi:hypothetical protein